MVTPTVPPKKRGCLFYGCLITSIVGVVGIVLAILAVRFLVKKTVEFTETQPATIQTVEISSADLTALQGRVDAFKAGLENPKEPQELILTADDINALIAHDPTFRKVAGKVYVMIEGDQVRGNVSIPLQDIGPFKLKGRYLNGVGTIGLALENGRLQVTLREVKVNGKSLPPAIMTELAKENWAKDVERDPKNANTLRKFETIKVEDGKVILRTKGPQ